MKDNIEPLEFKENYKNKEFLDKASLEVCKCMGVPAKCLECVDSPNLNSIINKVLWCGESSVMINAEVYTIMR